MDNIEKRLHNIIFLVIIITYFELFRFAFIPPFIRMLAPPVMGAGLLVLVLLKIISGHPGIKMHFTFPVLLLLIGSIPSYFTARAFHDQQFISSLFANSRVWFYLTYFYLHFYRIPVKFILRTIIIIGLFAVVLYFIQYSIYPAKLLDITMLRQRGTIRLLVPGMLCSQAAYFYFLNQFFTKRRASNLIMALLVFSIFVLQGTRQLLFGLTFLTIMYVLFSSQVKSKIGITVLVLLAIAAFFFTFREIINEMIKVSNRSDTSGLIRLKAAKFFLTDFMSNNLAYIFGNGDAGPGSSYYYQLFLYSKKYGFYLSDIGIIGDYVIYGIPFVLGGLYMLGKTLSFRVSNEYKFLKLYILIQCFTLFTSQGLFSGVDIIIVMIMYMFDVNRYELKVDLLERNQELNQNQI